MNFEEALHRFRHEIRDKYHNGEILKIAVDTPLFDDIIREVYTNSKGHYGFTNSFVNDFRLFGIEIVARKKDTF